MQSPHSEDVISPNFGDIIAASDFSTLFGGFPAEVGSDAFASEEGLIDRLSEAGTNKLPLEAGTNDFPPVAADKNHSPQHKPLSQAVSGLITAPETNIPGLYTNSTLTATSSSGSHQETSSIGNYSTAPPYFSNLAADFTWDGFFSQPRNEPSYETKFGDQKLCTSPSPLPFSISSNSLHNSSQTWPYPTCETTNHGLDQTNSVSLLAQFSNYGHGQAPNSQPAHYPSECQQNQTITWQQQGFNHNYYPQQPHAAQCDNADRNSLGLLATFDDPFNFTLPKELPPPTQNSSESSQQNNDLEASFGILSQSLSVEPTATQTGPLSQAVEASLLAALSSFNHTVSAHHPETDQAVIPSKNPTIDSDSDSASMELLSPDSRRRAIRKKTRIETTTNRLRSSKSSVDKRVKKQTDYGNLLPEKPKRDNKHPWIRVNASTQGKNLRSAKVNRFDPFVNGGYRETEHPIGDWEYKGTHFKYNKEGELLSEYYSTKEIEQFIWHHKGSLIMWIQQGPSDAQRRMPTNHSTECRFEDCPARKHYSGKINVGHLQVALDEQWTKYKKLRDPHHVAGFVHLYCMERFLDFPSICKRFDVRVDNRSFDKEPSGRFTGSLSYETGFDVAHKFIQSCKNGNFETEYPLYPSHPQLPESGPKDHSKTLTYFMMEQRVDRLCQAKLSFLAKRGNKLSHLHVNLGDLELGILSRLADAAEKRRLNRMKNQSGLVLVSSDQNVTKKRPQDVIDLENEQDSSNGNDSERGHSRSKRCRSE